jgi:ketosteroid isomerase-like protein
LANLTPLEIMERLSATWYPDSMGADSTVASWTSLFSRDVVLVEPGSLPHGGVHRGLAAFGQVQAGMQALWEQRIVDAEYWQCAPDRVALRIVIEWTARATGKSATLPMIDLISFNDGAITAIEAFVFDTAALLATLD